MYPNAFDHLFHNYIDNCIGWLLIFQFSIALISSVWVDETHIWSHRDYHYRSTDPNF